MKLTAPPPFIGNWVTVDENVLLGDGCKIYHNTVIRSNVVIGAGSVIGHCCVIERDTRIGKCTTIQSQCFIAAEAIIGDCCFIGPGVVMTNEKNIANLGRTEQRIETTRIGRGVRVGAASVLMPGITIGDNAYIAAGSIVTKDVPAGEYWKGIPARVSGQVPAEEYL